MRARRLIFFVLELLLCRATVSNAQTMYWDVDLISRTGAGSTAPSGVWNLTANSWNADSTGLGIPSPWTPGATAVFAAGSNATGTYIVAVSGSQSLSGLTVEEGAVTQNGGTLNFGTTFNASIDIAAGAAWGEASNGVITGTDGIVKNGAGTLYLQGNNTFKRLGAGNQAFLTITQGVVDFLSDANLGAVPSTNDNATALTLNGGALRYSGLTSVNLAANRGVYIGANGGKFEVVNQNVLSLPAGAPTASLSGSGTITKTGLGRLRLMTAQTTFTGKYIVKAGSLTFSSEDRLGAMPAATQADYFTLDGGGLYGELASGATLNAKRGITIGASGGYLAFSGTGLAYDGIIAGTQGGGLSLTTTDTMGTASTGTISLNSVNTYNGPTLIANGMTVNVTQLANGGANSPIGSSSNAATNLILDGGTLHYTGPAVSTDRNFTITSSGGFIDASGANNAPLTFTNTAAVGINGPGTHILVLRGTSTGDNIFSQAITDSASGATTLNKLDAGTWVLTNTANNYTGDTIISLGGRLKIGASGVVPDGSGIQLFSSSTFDLNGFNETVRSISGASGTIALGSKTLTINNPNSETYSAAITGAGGGRIVKNGTGRLTLAPSVAAYDGGVVLNAGTLVLGTYTALGSGTFVVNNSPTLSATASTTVFPLNPVTLAGNLTFDDTLAGASGSIIWGASGNRWTISGSDRSITVNSAAGNAGARIDQPIGEDLEGLGLIKNGNGTLTLNGVNTYTGPTSVLAGTLSVSETYFADWGGVVIAPGATLNLNFAGNTPDTIQALFVEGAFHLDGTWGAIGSGAEHETAQITGNGLLFVTPWEPPTGSLPLPGDFNNDGTVDMGDYIAWRKSNGTDNALFNDNGLGVPVGAEHLALWQQNYGNTRGPGVGLGGGVVPEPAASVLCISAMAMVTMFRRRLRTSKC